MHINITLIQTSGLQRTKSGGRADPERRNSGEVAEKQRRNSGEVFML